MFKKLTNWSRLLTLSITAVTIFFCLSCGNEFQLPEVDPRGPKPETVPELYVYIQSQDDVNPTRLEIWLDKGEPFRYSGVIRKIDGSSLQFLVKNQFAGFDWYLQCKFINPEALRSLNKGDIVAVEGRLEAVFPFLAQGAIRFNGCLVYSHQ